MRKIVAPLALLASITLLTSCAEKQTAVPVVPAVKTETPTPVEVVTPVTPATPVATGTTDTTTTTPATPKVLTRTETVNYDSRSPEGMVPVEFSLTVTDGVITAASASPKTDKEISKGFQESFAKSIGSVAVGKNAKNIKIDAVGGASLTTGAFEIFAHSF